MAEEVIFKIIEGQLQGEEFVFDEKGMCLIGRSADCALQIPKEKDMRISRRHCLLILDPPNVRVRDLGSRNGTTVNGKLLDAGTISEDPEQMTPVDKILKNGDVISIGETVLSVEVPSEKTAGVQLSQTKPHAKGTPSPTKVIKLTKPAPSQARSVIPQGQAVSSGFFAPPTPNTASRTIAMTEAIPRDEMKGREVPTKPSINAGSGIMQAKIISKGPGSVAPGPLAPPPKPKDDGGMTMMSPAAGSGPLAPPPPEKKPAVLLGKVVSKPPAPEVPADDAPVADTVDARPTTKVVAPLASGPKGTRLLTKKKSFDSPLPSGEEAAAEQAEAGQPKVLKAKIVNPGSTGARKMPKKLRGHMKTVVMDTKEFEEMPPDMIPPPSEDEAAAEQKPKKRVTKFKVKGPK